MAERNVGRPWTTEEDQLLIQAVNLYGDNDNWKTIALSVPQRTNKACRKRWLHSLCPNVKKTAWTSDEDQRLLQLYGLYGSKWSTIARQIPGRTDDACSKRYREALDPSLKKDEWTVDEDDKLMKAYQRLGGKWGQVGQELRRSGLGCRNRWRLLERRRAARGFSCNTLPAVPAQLVEAQPGGENSQSLNWQSAILVEPPIFWHSHMYRDNSVMEFDGHRPSPPLDDSPMSTLQECTPVSHHIPLTPSQDVPPFQYASSSLSTALSGPRPSQPLPPVNSDVSRDDTLDFKMHQLDPISSGSSSSHNDPSANFRSEDNISDDDFEISDPRHFISDPPDFPPIDGSSAISSPQEYTLRTVGSLAAGDDVGMHNGSQDSLASTSPSPLGLAGLTLSPTASPRLVASPVSLSSKARPPSGSMLFSSHGNIPPRTRKSSTPRKRPDPQSGPLRLSSNLPVASDPSILPYACGHERCWPLGLTTSLARFLTSKDLSEHGKVEHADDPGGDRLYRCGLETCGKSWKSINGLQYHLQISRAHFQHAISSALLAKPSVDVIMSSTPIPDGTKKTKRMYPCSHPNCPKVYRQLSGLRYHLLHGHPREMPAQLQVVPPTLARKVAEKLGSNHDVLPARP